MREDYLRGYNHGLNNGLNKFQEKFDSLDQIKGIGPKTLEKVRRHFGEQFFIKQGVRQTPNSPYNRKRFVQREQGDCYRPITLVHKAKHGIPTVLEVEGCRYILDAEQARKTFIKMGVKRPV